jgi:hypothetical protein
VRAAGDSLEVLGVGHRAASAGAGARMAPVATRRDWLAPARQRRTAGWRTRSSPSDAGIEVTGAPGALPELEVAFNINTDGYGDGISPDPTDQAVDPQFSAPAGPDGVLGNDGFADDDFRVQSTSPAIDAGSAPAAELGISGTAVAGGSGDEGIVDLGYHYGTDEL